MTQLPPPQLPNEPLASTPQPASRGMLRAGAIALVASTLAVGGIALGSQFVSANSPSVVQQPDDADSDDQAPAEPDPVVEDTAEADADSPNHVFEDCFFGSDVTQSGPFDMGDIDPEDLAELDPSEIGDLIDDVFDGSLEDCTSIAPEGYEDELAAWGEFDTCLNEQLGVDEFVGLPEAASVTIDLSSEDGLDFSIYNFSEGDGSITVTKSGDGVSVSTDGNVIELDDLFFAEIDEDFEAAHEACVEFLPEGAEMMASGGGFEIFADSDND